MSAISNARACSPWPDAGAGRLDQYRRNIVSVNPAARRGAAQNLHAGSPAAAADIGNPIRCIETQLSNERFIDRLEHRFRAAKPRQPLLAARVRPIGICRLCVHGVKFAPYHIQ